MNQSEREYIAFCRRLIEEKFQFEKANGNLRPRDLEFLADSIEEKSGIRLSLSTLKRIWKKDYDQTPHPSTLDALVSLLDYKSWQDFRLRPTQLLAESPGSIPKIKRRSPLRWWLVLPLLAAVVALIWLLAFRPENQGKLRPFVKGPVTFTGNKTVSQGVPNTIIFNYDLTHVVADSFFFQQSWNPMEKVKINPQDHYYSNIYYYPGFHKAKLIANDSILKRFRVHITTDGWLPILRHRFDDDMPVYIRKNHPVVNGALHITRNDLSSSVGNEFIMSYYNVREFGNTSSDNFSIDTRILIDSANAAPCPAFELVIICEEHIFFITMTGKGCERNIAIKMGEVVQNGMNTDLSAFGRDLYQWQRLRLKVVDKQAAIYINDQLVHTISFKNDFGKVMGIVYNFVGTGAVDYVKLIDRQGKAVYEDNFDK